MSGNRVMVSKAARRTRVERGPVVRAWAIEKARQALVSRSVVGADGPADPRDLIEVAAWIMAGEVIDR